MDLFIRVPSQLHGEHTVLQPFRRTELIIHISISVLIVNVAACHAVFVKLGAGFPEKYHVSPPFNIGTLFRFCVLGQSS